MKRPRRRKLKPSFPWAGYIFAVLLFALAGAFIWVPSLTNAAIWDQYESQSWPQVDGVVIFSKLRSEEFEDSETGTSTKYNAQVRTRYRVNGITYSVSEIYPGQSHQWTTNAGRVKRVLRRYRVGAHTAVFYSPLDPNVATLEPGLKFWATVMAMLGTVAAIGGLASLFYALRETVRFVKDRLAAIL